MSHSFVEKEHYDSALAKFRQLEEERMTQEIKFREAEEKLIAWIRDMERDFASTVTSIWDSESNAKTLIMQEKASVEKEKEQI